MASTIKYDMYKRHLIKLYLANCWNIWSSVFLFSFLAHLLLILAFDSRVIKTLTMLPPSGNKQKWVLSVFNHARVATRTTGMLIPHS